MQWMAWGGAVNEQGAHYDRFRKIVPTTPTRHIRCSVPQGGFESLKREKGHDRILRHQFTPGYLCVLFVYGVPDPSFALVEGPPSPASNDIFSLAD